MFDILCLNLPYLYPNRLPSFSRPSRSPSTTRGGTIYFPIALSTMVNYAYERGFSGFVLDCVIENYSEEDVLNFIKKTIIKPKVIVIDTSTPSIENDCNIADKIQKQNPNIKVVLVGRHVTYAPEETLQRYCKNVKLIAGREFYSQIIELLEGKDYKKIKGLTYKDDDKIIRNPDAEYIHPDEFGFISEVYKEQLHIKEYFYASCRYPYILLQAAWGCPHNCSFCNEVVKQNYRHRNTEHIIEELKFIKKELPYVKEILWDDPTFVVDEQFTQDLSNKIIEEKIKIKWSCATRANISFETLKIMKKSGFRLAHIGIESSSQEVLNSINKGMDINKETQYLHDCKKLGVLNHCCIIVGLPQDTEETIKNTLQYVKSVPIDSLQVFPPIPTPGLPFYEICKQKGYLLTEDYSQWLKADGSYAVVVNYPHLSNMAIEKWVERFYTEFYSRPSFILYKMKQSLLSYNELRRNYRGFKNLWYYGKNKKRL